MIFTACVACDKSLVVDYEAGDQGAGMFDRVVCPACGASNFVQLVSFGGVTIGEVDAMKRGLVRSSQ